MNRDAIYLSKASVFSLFSKYFFPTLFGMVSMSAVTAIDGIFVGHGVGSDGIAAVNFCVPVLMLLTGVGLMIGAGCSVVASIQLSRGKEKVARINVTQALVFVTIVALIPVLSPCCAEWYSSCPPSSSCPVSPAPTASGSPSPCPSC